MGSELQSKDERYQLAENVLADGNSQWETERFIEQIRHDLGGVASNGHIRRVLMETAPVYENARVKNFVPILLRRDVVRRVRDELGLNQEAEVSKPENAKKG